MARLLNNEPVASSKSSTTSAVQDSKTMGDNDGTLKVPTDLNGPSSSSGSFINKSAATVSARKLSFKLRSANSSQSSRPSYRANRSKVNSNNVTALANKFNNAVIVQETTEKGVTRKRNNGKSIKRTPTKPKEGSVHAAIQQFENTNNEKRKNVISRKNSTNRRYVSSTNKYKCKLDDVQETDNFQTPSTEIHQRLNSIVKKKIKKFESNSNSDDNKCKEKDTINLEKTEFKRSKDEDSDDNKSIEKDTINLEKTEFKRSKDEEFSKRQTYRKCLITPDFDNLQNILINNNNNNNSNDNNNDGKTSENSIYSSDSNIKPNKPEVKPKPNKTKIKSAIEKSTHIKSLTLPPSFSHKNSSTNDNLKLSLAKDQSGLETALNENSSSSNNEEIIKTFVKNSTSSSTLYSDTMKELISKTTSTLLSYPKTCTNNELETSKPIIKPNTSFLWPRGSNHSISNNNVSNNTQENSMKLVNDMKKHENLIMKGFKNNIETKLISDTSSNNDSDMKKLNSSEKINKIGIPILMNGNTNEIPIRNQNGLNFVDKFTKINHDDIEEKENVTILNHDILSDDSLLRSHRNSSVSSSNGTIYEEIENTKNTESINRSSFIYRNIYITEARNENVVPIEAKNQSVSLINQETYEVINEHPQRIGYIAPSKLSYGYVDPGNYEDLETYAEIPEEVDHIYDDVMNIRMAVRDMESTHYESVYQQSEVCSVTFEKDSSDSSCDQSNSLYGMARDGRPCSRSSSVSYGTGHPIARSETSDEWMDVDNSDHEETRDFKNCDHEETRVIKKRDRPKVRLAITGDWRTKVRRQLSKRINRSCPDGSDSETNSHQYEMVQRQDVLAPSVNHHFDGSFDSDSSFDDEIDQHDRRLPDKYQSSHCDRTLPSIPHQNDSIYGLMKEAGRRMRKHWSIGKSLRSIRKKSGGSTPTTPEQAETNGSSLNRKTWSSIKRKFQTNTSSSGSTFYLDSDQFSDKQDTSESCDRQSTSYTSCLSATTSQSTSSINVHNPQVDTRRFSMSSLRPTSPPPPPPTGIQKSPPNNSNDESPKRPSRSGNSNTSNSWYSETDAFYSINGSMSEGSNNTRSTTWYSDAGLWESNTLTGDSQSENSSTHGSDLQLRFPDEPLYQFYDATVTAEELDFCYSTIDRDSYEESQYSEDTYEEIGEHFLSRPSAIDIVTPKHGRNEHHRSLWCEIPEVKNSEIFAIMNNNERKLQEAKFEVVTSEASYFKSLTVLEKHFASSPLLQDEAVLTSKDKKCLFGQVPLVRKCSEKLLSSLDKCWQESIMMANVCEIVYRHAVTHFHVYITYCSQQVGLNATLKKLKETNKKFDEALTLLESDPKCQSLSLHSFLMLPMQRITRMPLLLDAILTRLDPSTQEYSSCQMALRTLHEFVRRCNEETRQQERMIELVKLSRQLQFDKEVRTFPIVSKNRWLVRSGQVLHLNTEVRQTLGYKFSKQGVKLTLFLFNDVLLLAKRKSEESYLVTDHCQKNLLQMTEEPDINSSLQYLVKLAMFENHEGKLVELILSCDSETSRQRWMQAVAPPAAENPGESVYEPWDCPQVVAIHTYNSIQPDEISLQKGDILNVLRKMGDGWYCGERTRDGEKGWFPGNHVHEIISSHVRARNLRQRYRLLALSGNYLLERQSNVAKK